MYEKLRKLAGTAKEAISTAAVLVGDLNGDGKVDTELMTYQNTNKSLVI